MLPSRISASGNPYLCSQIPSRWSTYSASLCLAISTLFDDKSNEVIKAPALWNCNVSVPNPHPSSSTRLPFHNSNSAKWTMCGSTWYFLFWTSSQYLLGQSTGSGTCSWDPTVLSEWRKLHGLVSQYAFTRSTISAMSSVSTKTSLPRTKLSLYVLNKVRCCFLRTLVKDRWSAWSYWDLKALLKKISQRQVCIFHTTCVLFCVNFNVMGFFPRR